MYFRRRKARKSKLAASTYILSSHPRISTESQELQIQTVISRSSITINMEVICDYEFDLSKPIFLLHPNDKFWEVTIEGATVTFRVGKIRGGAEVGQEKVEKDYASVAAARVTAIQKIKDKLTKGYFSKDAKYREPPKEEKSNKQAILRQADRKFKSFSGEYYQTNDGKDFVKIEINGKKVRITRNVEAKKNQEVSTRQFQTQDDAIIECIAEQERLKKNGYKAMNHKFLYTFVDEKSEEKKTKSKGESKGGKNILSITAMTDDAMSHRSRNTSEAKSDRSFHSSDLDGEFKDTKTALGPPISGCIKVLLAETYGDSIDPTGWIMSEKLDGVRCFWTGSVMFSRNGNRFFPPKFFTRNWPNSQLDGQLFIGRGRFSETISAVKKGSPIDDEWKKVNYLVFDCPGLKKPFKTRIKALQKTLSEIDNPYIKCHAHRECTGFADLFQELDKVNKIDGQGVMLRDPQAHYQNRRSKSLLKVKTFHDDEAEVIGYSAGTGRCTGMVGALKVRNSFGVEFEVGSGLTDALRRKPPKIGSKITYKYQQFNKDSGKPRFPTYMRAYEQI